MYVKQKATQPIFIIIKDNKSHSFFPAVQNTIVYIRVWKTILRLLYLHERCVTDENVKVCNNQEMAQSEEISTKKTEVGKIQIDN